MVCAWSPRQRRGGGGGVGRGGGGDIGQPVTVHQAFTMCKMQAIRSDKSLNVELRRLADL